MNVLFYQWGWSLPIRSILRKYARQLFLWALALAGIACYLLAALLNSMRADLPSVNKLRGFEPAQTTRIFSSDGQLIGTLFRENRTWIPLKEMSPWLIKAILATEDSRFYEHSGVDPIGVARAALEDLRSGGSHQGASTITMQLARNMFLTREKSLGRKIKEALLAQELERQFTKDEILEFYLNQIYFGSGAYGVQAASSQYFGKSAARLQPAEAALLAGLPKAPTELSPFVNPKAARDRQMLVLTRMHDLGDLTWEQYHRATDAVAHQKFPRRSARKQLLKVPYFTSYVIRELSQRYSEEQLYQGGLSIYTTVDLKLQAEAERAVNELVGADEYALNVHEGALVTVENGTGSIRAMVGGRGFKESNQFNRAWQARRQAGSSFKPLVYATALEHGFTPTTIIDDKPTIFKTDDGTTWEPKNSDGRFLGPIPMWLGLQGSRNVIAAQVIAAVSPLSVVDMARRMGLEGLQPRLSLALGAVEVSPLQMVEAYSTIANGGTRVEPTAILRVVDADQHVLEDNRRRPMQSVLTPRVSATLIWMMRRVVDWGTATQAALPGRQVAGKTGTTDSHRDAWFVGFTTDYTTAVWTGNDDFSRMWGAFGGDLPARIFRRVMLAASEGKPAHPFPTPSGEAPVSVPLCSATHLRPNGACPKTYNVSFDPDLVPTERCALHRKTENVSRPASYPQAPSASPTPAESDDVEPLEFVPAPETPLPSDTPAPIEEGEENE